MTISKVEFSTDCIHWVGRMPCVIQKSTNQKSCRGCSAYKPCRKNILIVKVGGLGSITRSLVVAQEFRHKFRKDNCKIQYLTHTKGKDLLQYSSAVDEVLDINDWTSLNFLAVQKFDILVNFECSKMALAVVGKVDVDLKLGFLPDFKGSPYVKDSSSVEFATLQTNNYFRKKVNKKSMQQIFLEVAGLTWKKQCYQLHINEADKAYAQKFFSHINLTKRIK